MSNVTDIALFPLNQMVHAKLEQLTSSHDNIRTKETEGLCLFPPPSEGFMLLARPLSAEFACRAIMTSSIIAVVSASESEVVFRTRNSLYRLTRLPETEESAAFRETMENADFENRADGRNSAI